MGRRLANLGVLESCTAVLKFGTKVAFNVMDQARFSGQKIVQKKY